MKYFYYPGCSLEHSAKEYDVSARALMRLLGHELIEVDDWTCCGASAADTTSRLLSIVLPARNLALAQKSGVRADMLVPCSSCYLNLRRADDLISRDGLTADLTNRVLKEEGLSYAGGIRVRHLLDVLANDIGAEAIAAGLKQSLSGLSVAPYYGCQALRPFSDFDDPEQPHSMDALIGAAGASVFDWSMAAKCCGAGLMTTKKELCLELVADILGAAKGADCIATVCPMCQMNLEISQKKISRMRGKALEIAIVYLPQLLGYSLGLPRDGLRLDLNLALTGSFKDLLADMSKQVAVPGR
ncbi:MAG: CoB--CoM heterodisulfide reductase iron-sulfur subunit B family protein [Deltaproteobacteria bacterium]|nr:CoB--CoM heterodisulfide reductase iron-sulfur subunit B family protein [Deltaproteobacteria bacterium]